jgi:ABC-type dipeptide/oligopeptide/nickel transport system permease subunit
LTDHIETDIARSQLAVTPSHDYDEVLPGEILVEEGVRLDDAEGLNVRGLSPTKLAWKRYWRHKGAAVSTVIMGLLIVAVVATPITARYGINQPVRNIRDGNNVYLEPQSLAWFGTDNIGRDIFSRVVYGGRMSLLIAVTATVVGLAVGGLFGMVAGYYGRRTDRVISAGTDVLLAFPALVLVLALVGVLGERPWFADKRAWLVITSLAILSIAPLTRIVRASTMVYSHREFVMAARSLGAKNRRIMVREVLPNVVPSMVSFALTGLALLIIAEGALAFLGQSVKVPTPTWGLMINEGRQNLEDAPWISLMPAAVMFLTILAFNLIGDVLSKRFDIKESLL